jgi:hypothetical protein
LNKGWQHGNNQIVITVEHNGWPEYRLLVQPSGAPLCAGKLSVIKNTTQDTPVFTGQSGVPFEVIVVNNSTTATDDFSGTILNDLLPAGLASGTWTCSNNGTAAACPANSGNLLLNETLTHLPAGNLQAGSSLRFSILANVASTLPATPVITNTATLTRPVGTAAGVCLNVNGSDSCTASASIAFVSTSSAAVPTLGQSALGALAALLALLSWPALRSRFKN